MNDNMTCEKGCQRPSQTASYYGLGLADAKKKEENTQTNSILTETIEALRRNQTTFETGNSEHDWTPANQFEHFHKNQTA